MSDWCILRMSRHRTLPVVRSLRAVGIEAWAPSMIERKRRPRSDKYRDVEVPVLPEFAFVRSRYEADVLAIEHSPVSRHPAFTVLLHRDMVPKIADAALDPLREYEARARTEWEDFLKAQRLAAKKSNRKRGKHNARSYVLGTIGRVPDTAFEGLDGEIVEVKANGDLVLTFSGSALSATIDACLFEPIVLAGSLAVEAKAA